MLSWDHGGGFSLDASVRIEATDRAGLERLIRYCARPPFALDRLHVVSNRSDPILYVLPGPDPAGRTALRLSALEFLDRLATILPPPRIHRHRSLPHLLDERGRMTTLDRAEASASGRREPPPHPPDTAPARTSRWAALLARLYEALPLICPTCQTPLTFIAVLTDPKPITQILLHIGEPTSPPLLHPARGPPQTGLAMAPGGGQAEKAAQQSLPHELDQSPEFDPTEPEPIPVDDFDQGWDA